MTPNEWLVKFNEQIKDTGYQMIMIKSHNNALMWQALEIMLYIQVCHMSLFAIDPKLGAFGYIAGIIATYAVIFGFIRKLKDPRINCWKE